MSTQLIDIASKMTLMNFVVAAASLYLVSAALLLVYRLYFHPLRRVPGPRLAACTRWVETYYECFKAPGGQFMWEYQRWHEKYGPIVRIGPNEVHIQDPSFYETLYAQSRHSDKLKRLDNRFDNRTAAFSTAEHKLHRMRRTALNPYFSKKRIMQHSTNIQAHMDKLCERISSEYLESSAPLNLNNMWAAFAADIVVGYCFEKSYNFILNPDFRAGFADAIAAALEPVHFVTQFPWIMSLMLSLPDSLVQFLSPEMRPVIEFKAELRDQIRRATINQGSADKTTATSQTLYAALLESELPPAELSMDRLQHESFGVVGGGIETTMYTLSTCSYHLLANPPILARLQQELRAAMPDPDQAPPVDQLMQLPYLTAVVSEALRFAYGIPQRLPRLSPTVVVYPTPEKDYALPVGTEISMDNYTMSHDPEIFPDPYAFRPERWEGDPRAPDGKPLSKYMVAFGRGTRHCVGMHLAYTEIYIALASFFRRYSCELYETERDAVDCFMDRFVPRPKPGTKGVRVKVLHHL